MGIPSVASDTHSLIHFAVFCCVGCNVENHGSFGEFSCEILGSLFGHQKAPSLDEACVNPNANVIIAFSIAVTSAMLAANTV
jgi:hypothetical protein